MTYEPHGVSNRLERRKRRTRAALIKAAQGFIAVGNVNVPVLEITQAADVGMGSFYNHFDSKEQLFQAALDEILDKFGALLDGLPPVEDPAETFARGVRLTVRWLRRRPEEVRLLLDVGVGRLLSDRGLMSRASRDIAAADRVGRFRIDDPQLAVTLATGSMFALTQLLHEQPERDDARAADRLAADLLVVYGLSRREAQEVCVRRLPDLDDIMVEGASASA
ncbi:MAG: TetR/AcrR family transcriptional regulator [Mycobacterium sp.]